ncbi:HAD hydrolase family protein [Nocardioides sp. YIM 152315]|uniref:HAD hydrolase family protein n=1 Tax=Nocardioides sp. YIM 152315 TaxID=3031760 RepID=UPI0023DA0E20|nr:HAD hydrolase family protein [Nocardioides sp. YIM 152315]MDF1605477.1 HAD hydrolase family protein [Nocardioides sp. YIM 152315]
MTDLDGTLVARDLELVDRSAVAIRAWIDDEHECIVATGRNEESARRYHAALGLQSPMILFNGARVVAASGEVLLSRTLGDAWPTLRRDVLSTLPPTVGAVAFVDDRAIVVRDAPALTDYARRDRIALLHDPLADDAEVTKVMLIVPAPPMDALADRVRAVCPELVVVASEPTYLEVLPADATKGTALRWLAADRGVDLADVAAIGDNPNDIPMIEVAGLGIAVGDGHPDVVASADLVVGPCASGAVADAVEAISGATASRSH